ncbi:MAG: hypothetical protein LASZOEIN_001561 [Candidatus Fervidibacter sp.]
MASSEWRIVNGFDHPQSYGLSVEGCGSGFSSEHKTHNSQLSLHLLFRARQKPADDGTEQGSPDGACGYASTAATFSRRKSDDLL